MLSQSCVFMCSMLELELIWGILNWNCRLMLMSFPFKGNLLHLLCYSIYLNFMYELNNAHTNTRQWNAQSPGGYVPENSGVSNSHLFICHVGPPKFSTLYFAVNLLAVVRFPSKCIGRSLWLPCRAYADQMCADLWFQVGRCRLWFIPPLLYDT